MWRVAQWGMSAQQLGTRNRARARMGSQHRERPPAATIHCDHLLWLSAATTGWHPNCPPVPTRLLVMMMIVLLKATVRPLESVSLQGCTNKHTRAHGRGQLKPHCMQADRSSAGSAVCQPPTAAASQPAGKGRWKGRTAKAHRPSSSTPSRMFITSACAFSTSSNRTTE